MKRHTIAATLLLLALAASYLLATAQTDPAPPLDLDARFQIVRVEGVGAFLLNTRTGDTWTWYHTDERRMGWQYQARPLRIDGCSSEKPICRPIPQDQPTPTPFEDPRFDVVVPPPPAPPDLDLEPPRLTR